MSTGRLVANVEKIMGFTDPVQFFGQVGARSRRSVGCVARKTGLAQRIARECKIKKILEMSTRLLNIKMAALKSSIWVLDDLNEEKRRNN